MSAAFIPMKCMDQIAPPPSATDAPVTEPTTAAQVRACGIAIASCKAVYEPGQKFTASGFARTAERAMGQRDIGVACVHLAEGLQGGNQGSPQRDRHLERTAERPFLFVRESAYFFPRLEQFPVAGFRSE